MERPAVAMVLTRRSRDVDARAGHPMLPGFVAARTPFLRAR